MANKKRHDQQLGMQMNRKIEHLARHLFLQLMPFNTH